MISHEWRRLSFGFAAAAASCGLAVGGAVAAAEDPIHAEYGLRCPGVLVGQPTAAQLYEAYCREARPRFREATDVDWSRVRAMRGAGPSRSLLEAREAGEGVADIGLRVELNFVDEVEEAELVLEAEAAVQSYGFDFAKMDAHRMGTHVVVGGRREEIEMWRCTGRPEADSGAVAPWAYAASFDPSRLPPAIRRTAERIRSTPGYRLGPLRDVSINIRTHSYFFTSPHVDPLTDGPSVFVLGLRSAAVLTFSPKLEHFEAAGHHRHLDASRFRSGEAVERESWSDYDLDVLVKKRTLAGFTGEARYLWNHGLRNGFEVDLPGESSPSRLDFWGDFQNVVKRSPERISLVFSFGDA